MATSPVRRVFRWLLAALFVLAGILHFARPQFYFEMMPPFLPFPLELVYVSGAFEILGGVGILIPRLRLWAGWGLIALLICVFPANLQMFLNHFSAEGWTLFTVVLLIRLPLQLLLIAWVRWCMISDSP